MHNFIELLYSALSAEIGIVIETDDLDLCKQRLYAARKQSGDPALNDLSIIVSPMIPNQLWIVKRTLDETQGALPDPKSDLEP